jgi:glycerate-2-kinase
MSAAGASRLVRRALRDRAVGGDIGDRTPVIVAAGKAAAEMAGTFVAEVPGAGAEGLIASPQPGAPGGDLEWFDVGHPVPTGGSVAAGRRALELATGLAPREVMVLLLSGGASAGLAAPLSGLTLEEKSAATSVLLRSGVAIDGLNCVRKHLSAIKGGRLAVAARGRVVTLAISDVVDPVPDDPAVIGSGPTTPDPTTFAEALAICRAASDVGELPRAVLDVLERGARGGIEESPKPGDARLAGAAYHRIGSRREATEGAANKARELGYAVAIIDEPVTGEARRAAEHYVRTIARLAYERPRPLCIVSAGETTVRVTGKGRGGRNQEFALAAAFHLARRFPAAVVASVGSDGVDGPTDAAGALVDTTTPARAGERGLHRPERYLAENDSYTFFDALGDLVRTGPTDTNVGDLQVALIG